MTTSASLAEDVRYNVAAILPMSGVGASVGDAIKNGLILGLEHLPTDVRQRLQLTFEDDSSQPMKALAAFQKVRSIGGVTAVISGMASCGHAIAVESEAAGVPLISISVDSTIAADTDHTVVLWSPMEDMAKAAVNEALTRGYKRVAVVMTQNVGNHLMLSAFKNENKGRLELIELPEFDPAETDFNAAFTRLRAEKDLDGIAVFVHPGVIGLFAKQARQKGIKLPLFALVNFEDAAAVKSSDGALIGQWYVQMVDPEEALLKEYHARFPNGSLVGAMGGYEAIMLLGDALKKNIQPKDLSSFLRNVKDFHGSVGTYSSTPDHLYSIPVAVKEVLPDGFRQIRVIENQR